MINFTLFDAFRACGRAVERPGAAPVSSSKSWQYVGVNDDERRHTTTSSESTSSAALGGTIALALAALDYRGSTTAPRCVSSPSSRSYEGDAWLMKVQYAKWLITGDVALARSAFLDDPVHKKGSLLRGVRAVADLHHAAALPTLQRLSPTLKKDGVAGRGVQGGDRAAARARPRRRPPPIAHR